MSLQKRKILSQEGIFLLISNNKEQQNRASRCLLFQIVLCKAVCSGGGGTPDPNRAFILSGLHYRMNTFLCVRATNKTHPRPSPSPLGSGQDIGHYLPLILYCLIIVKQRNKQRIENQSLTQPRPCWHRISYRIKWGEKNKMLPTWKYKVVLRLKWKGEASSVFVIAGEFTFPVPLNMA